MTYSIEKVTTLIGAHRYGNNDCCIAFLLTDSRSLSIPEETLFFAIRTKVGDGHQYINDLYLRGVRNFVVETVPADWQERYADANFLKVVNTLSALQRLAERHRDEFNIPIVGITGSNGKTVIKEWLYQLLSPYRKVTRSPRSFNSQIGVPLSVWLLDETTEAALFEAGISQKGEMDALQRIIQPTIGVITNIGPAHQENFGTIEEKCREKLRLFKDAETIVFCADDEIVVKCLAENKPKGQLLCWSQTDASADLYVTKITKNDTTTDIAFIYNEGRKDDNEGTKNDNERTKDDNERTKNDNERRRCFTIPFIDDASIRNTITAALICLHLGLTPEQIASEMKKLEPVAMRLEVKRGRNGCTIINDSYNSDINSLDIALDFMHRRSTRYNDNANSTYTLRSTLILSDICQSGESPDVLYKRVSDMAVARGISRFIGIGSDLCSAASQIDIADKHFFTSTDEFIASQLFNSLAGEMILLKGARKFGFDRLSELLVRKVHETTLEVNLSAMVDNLNYYRSLMKPETKLVCMIKADGYGTGAVEIAKTLQDHRVDYLAVAVADEGVTLRRTGITQSIMIMNPEMSAFKTMFDNDLEPEVYSFRLLDALIRAAEREGIMGYPVHIKLDTGMHRLGFDPVGDIDKLIQRLKSQNAIIPRSVFSHFAGADDDSFDSFSAHQYELFTLGADKLQAAFPHKILRHIDNSAGIEHFPERQMDMCRLGLGLYGINPRNNATINNVASLHTTILQLRHVPAGETVGYSRRGTIDHDSVIAAIPIGYADGLDRHIGNRKGYCLVNGHRAEYVGNICMDVAMIDVTGIPCHEGDSVEIFGDNLPVTTLSDKLGTIPYEILTGISNRVKRVYFQD
ncbi:MAG: bifunctional UDP-N-acetylmuramoyl-tripeptide:D-alanyl-D-alanine ligase/alanine racemase [Prevotella sp.]|nr:bifunctional UDP-N-acetylmuramoyl-tripeptide:D-alanyl-D-alanine ligase/alanine racemase [Prevotella sp.]